MTPRVLIGVPVFNGSQTLPETLRSIQAQTFRDAGVLISVDAGDADSEEAIRPFMADPRFRLVHQPERRGWAGNLDWLMRQSEGEFFCYWQQDDLASQNYIEDLVSVHDSNPGSSVTYSDVQWFGAAFAREALSSIDARSPYMRVVQFMDSQHWIPLRGIIPTDLITDLPDWARLRSTSPWENGFLAFLAGCGPMIRSDGSLYFKRAHQQQWGSSFESRPLDQRRRDWITRARTLLTALDTFSIEGASAASLALVVDRFTLTPPGRFVDYRYTQEPALGRFLRDWQALYLGELDDRLATLPVGVGWPHDSVEDARVERSAALARARAIEGDSSMSLTPASEFSGEPYVGFGWSHREKWGVWSEVPSPSLFIPRASTHAVLTLRGALFGPAGEPARLEWTIEGGTSGRLTAACGEPLELEIPTKPEDCLLSLHLPDAMPPAEIEVSNDPRTLGFGLTGMDVRLTGPIRSADV